MARIRMVTRTIIITEAVVAVADKTDSKVKEILVTVPLEYKEKSALEKVIKKGWSDDSTVPLWVKEFHTIEQLYGMTEEEFIKNASILPNRE